MVKRNIPNFNEEANEDSFEPSEGDELGLELADEI